MKAPWWWPVSGKPDNERSWTPISGPLIRPGKIAPPARVPAPAEIVLVPVVIGGITHLKAMPRRHQ